MIETFVQVGALTLKRFFRFRKLYLELATSKKTISPARQVGFKLNCTKLKNNEDFT